MDLEHSHAPRSVEIGQFLSTSRLGAAEDFSLTASESLAPTCAAGKPTANRSQMEIAHEMSAPKIVDALQVAFERHMAQTPGADPRAVREALAHAMRSALGAHETGGSTLLGVASLLLAASSSLSEAADAHDDAPRGAWGAKLPARHLRSDKADRRSAGRGAEDRDDEQEQDAEESVDWASKGLVVTSEPIVQHTACVPTPIYSASWEASAHPYELYVHSPERPWGALPTPAAYTFGGKPMPDGSVPNGDLASASAWLAPLCVSLAPTSGVNSSSSAPAAFAATSGQGLIFGRGNGMNPAAIPYACRAAAWPAASTPMSFPASPLLPMPMAVAISPMPIDWLGDKLRSLREAKVAGSASAQTKAEGGMGPRLSLYESKTIPA